MDALDLGVNLFVALFALVDPIGNIPIFAAATAGASARQRLQVSGLICIFIVAFLILFFFTGLSLLQFFGISLAAFRIAGGILLLLLGLDMTREDFLTMFADADAAALHTIGIDLDAVRTKIEEAFGPGALEQLAAMGEPCEPTGGKLFRRRRTPERTT